MVASLEAGDLVLASLEAVMTGFPDLGRAGFGRLAGVADLEKAGTAWQDEPRIPAGQSNGGQWTTGGVGAASSPRINGERALDSTPDKDSTRAQLPGLDDGVYHPGHDSPVLVPAGGPGDAEEGFRQGIGGNEPPYDFMELSELFPGLRDAPGLEIPLAPIDSFLGFSALANESNLQATSAVYGYLYDQIKAMDPSYRDDELQSLAEMSWEGRAAVIDKLLMDRAADYYRFKHEIEPLQVETVKLLQREVDKAYTEAVRDYKGNAPQGSRAWSAAIGRAVDTTVRDVLREVFVESRVPYGAGQNITVNNRDKRSEDQSYKVPDARIGNMSIDWTLTPKSLANAQVRGFFRADSAPDFVVIIRPSQLGGGRSYVITRPAGDIRRTEDASRI
jgi:hypothetical protein